MKVTAQKTANKTRVKERLTLFAFQLGVFHLVAFLLLYLGPGQTPYLTWAESKANENRKALAYDSAHVKWSRRQ